MLNMRNTMVHMRLPLGSGDLIENKKALRCYGSFIW